MNLTRHDYETYISCALNSSVEIEAKARDVMDEVIDEMGGMDHDLATKILQGLRELLLTNSTIPSHLGSLTSILKHKTEVEISHE